MLFLRVQSEKQTAMSLITVVMVLAVLGPHVRATSAPPDCSGLAQGCHVLAYCEQETSTSEPFCACQRGTIDSSDGAGTDCDTNAFAVRYVVHARLEGRRDSWLSRPDDEAISEFCASGTKGFYLRSVENGQHGANPRDSSQSEVLEPVMANPRDSSQSEVLEVNCLYSDQESANSSLSEYSSICDPCIAEPQVYSWTLPTTSSPLRIPPTGLTIDSVHFVSACAESGCWVLKGTMTTGEAFNSYEVFNTFYLPQADITEEHPAGDLSYDYDYKAVEWTFEPAQNPCTSVNYQAGEIQEGRIDKVSTCCINDPENDDNGGFVANYRPTEKFTAWASRLRCDVKFTTSSGETACWKVYDDVTTWPQAELRCQAAGGQLATISDEDENHRMHQLLFRKTSGPTWIGLKNREREEVLQSIFSDCESMQECVESWTQSENENFAEDFFEWVDGSDLSYTNWDDHYSYEDDYSYNSNHINYYDGDGNIVDTFVSFKHLITASRTSGGAEVDISGAASCFSSFFNEEFEEAWFSNWSGVWGQSWSESSGNTFGCSGRTAHGMFLPGPLGGNGSWTFSTLVDTELPYVCEFAPPAECLPHVIQRPHYSAPPPKEETCWEVHGDYPSADWNEAQAECASAGGHLAVLRDEEDHFFLKRVLDHAGVYWAWIGMSDQAEEGKWRWVDGAPVTFTAWWGYDYWGFEYLTENSYSNWYENNNWFRYEYEESEKISSSFFFEDDDEGWYDFHDYQQSHSYYWYNGYDCVHLGYCDGYEGEWGRGGEGGGEYDRTETQDCAYMRAWNGMWYRAACDDARVGFFVCEVPRVNATTCHSDLVSATDPTWDIPFPFQYQAFMTGKFKGLTASPGVVSFANTDPFFGQYKFEIHLDEVELRSKAGKLRGTVGVEHTVDTFLGLANFRPTGIAVLDTFVTQTNLHLEKTSFFTVSTHGVNQYTFLEYVNMRLVTIHKQNDDFSDASSLNNGGGSTLDFIGTNSTGSADYVQVTFTLGPQYEINANSDLIPSSSVRAGKGTFLEDAESSGEMTHKCDEYAGEFSTLLLQDCSPNSVMCSSPTSIPDQFVSYNIPLGIDYLPAATSDLSANIFVHMVVSAIIKESARAGAGFADVPNDGGNPFQMKTTLSASIPVVEGGINIFCDGLVSKTDLKDVANADIIVGSASSSDQLTRLRIKKNIASTQLAEADEVVIDSDSIEAGLMTLVLHGNVSYFGNSVTNSGNQLVSIELEDVVTIHVMQDDGVGENADVITRTGGIQDLLDDPPDDNSFADGLDTNGYALNGAFFFTIDRASQRAHLEPSSDLLSICPFNPTRPSGMELETCITRRDVRYRGYPARTASYSTAMEICANVVNNAGDDCSFAYDASSYDSSSCCTQLTTSAESRFFTTIFGNSDYAKQLAVDFANVVADEYQLNGRFRRAYWINPGYEWTPTQTGGSSIFQVSQKLFMFALITLDEGIVASGNDATPPARSLPTVRRRMLLQTADGLKDAQASGAGNVMTFQTTPTSMMAKAFDVPVDKVATFAVKLQLTEAEACKTGAELQDALRLTLDDYMSGAASSYETVQVTKMTVNKGSVECASARRSVRSLLAFSDATADVTMLVVFSKGGEATISLEKLAAMSGVQSIEPVSVSPKIKTADASYVPPPPPSSSSSSNTALIAGIAGGVGGLLLVGAGVAMYMRNKAGAEIATASAMQTIDVNALKAQLANEA